MSIRNYNTCQVQRLHGIDFTFIIIVLVDIHLHFLSLVYKVSITFN